MKIHGIALGLGLLLASQVLSAAEPKGSKFPLRPSAFATSYVTVDGALAEVEYREVKTLRYKDRLVLYRKLVIHVKTNSILPWKREFKLTGWMVGGYLELIEGDDSDQALGTIATFTPITPADAESIGKLIPRDSADEADAPVWFWKGGPKNSVSFPW